ncbi:NAD-dependent epimerase/dehydratase family protein [Aquicoccus sp. G2-2]|uniref:NAD-dependent epimerase/dehydratase family protein n=1 Tax=Aquicoccus sp. G2-2 TaxID=3092120 RepID=UPI002AE00878|nr:NAD-dependent epimerase/dehydratase family protein [Aquicoccus sp. G2-2]MEA1114114.1 NAD-dependent epimerase/dehydratase family protein [Aquicoccus sp. G2-2]
MFEIDLKRPALVTGASGYVAGWIVKGLLEAGATVHAAVRDPQSQKVAPLKTMAEATPGTLRLFAADLLDNGSYADAMKTCGIVFHTASPFSLNVDDPQKELIDPALLGTRNVLEEVNRTSSVTRVVLTSSCAAIYTDACDTTNAPGGRLDESVWNETASLDYQPYSYSKTLAEREAWKIAKAQSRWDLVVLNPSMVMGPASHGVPSSESFNIMRQIGNGTFRMGAPRLGLGMVDVRDLAQAHLAAAYLPKAEGRNIISAHETNLLELAMCLRERFGADYPLPRRALPKWLLWLAGPSQGIERKFVARNVNFPWRADNSKARLSLGLSYRPMKETMEDMFDQMAKAKAFAKT